jgi:arsenate reductase (thioredoxin)
MMSGKSQLLPALQITVDKLSAEFKQISSTRRDLLASLTDFIQLRTKQHLPVNLNFICTHNSRRSHIAQLWAQAAANYYGIPNVHCFSGGTEATAFNPRAVKAMREAGFSIKSIKEADNPLYEVRFAESTEPGIVFSKRYDDAFNSSKDFAAVMTCSHADENCPIIFGAIKRIALTYDDPKDFDGTTLEESKYSERVHEIGREILYAFSKVISTAAGE